MKVVVVIPAFNESAVIFQVLKSIPKRIQGIKKVEIIVVDDGSTDTTKEEAVRAGVNVVSHLLNRGVGAATKTGIHWAIKKNADLVITFDADNQHFSEDIPKLVNPIIKNKADLVIGTRFKRKQQIPQDRIILNWLANFATFILFGVFSNDSQSGFRAMSKKTMELIDFKSDRMEFSSEILTEAKKNNLKVKEVPIKVRYTPYSRIKGQKNTNAFPIFARFLIKLFR